MRRTIAITPEEPRRVYWTKVLIAFRGVMMVGQLTSSIAHEINQPMAGVLALRAAMRR
jgi:C4-dicarboxylate-specific signal transduction histidine kinase